MKKILILISVLSSSLSHGQLASCCSKPITMASLADDPNFIIAHEAPLPFNYTSQAGKMITFPTSDGKTGSAYAVMAATPTTNTLIICHEYWGLNDYIKQRADELQKSIGNINVIAIDMYDGKVSSNSDSAAKLMQSMSDARIKNIIKGAITYAGPKAKIFSMGWCFGGGYSLQTAILAGKQAAGCIMYYGMPEKDLNVLKTLNCSVLGLFGTKDGWITPEVVKTFQDNMKAAGKTLTVKSYDAPHAFANPSNPKYDKASADDANTTALAYIKGLLR